jgi:hypothetical protein
VTMFGGIKTFTMALIGNLIMEKNKNNLGKT